MLKYLYAQQKSKLIFFVVFSLLSSLFEIALSFVMLQSVNLAMDGNLSDALNDGLWFGLYIFCYFIVDLICRRLRWSVIQGCQTHLRDELIKKILFLMKRLDFKIYLWAFKKIAWFLSTFKHHFYILHFLFCKTQSRKFF